MTITKGNEMPNWVYNTLTIQGPKEEIDYIKDRLNRPTTFIHIRMTELLMRNMPASQLVQVQM